MHQNLASGSSEKQAAESSGVESEKKKRHKDLFCLKVLVGDELKKAMARFETVGPTSEVGGAPSF